mgnify:CR=1 FL=1
MIEKALREIDPDSYRSQIHELQREIGRYQSAVIVDFQATPFDLVWPWVQNWNVWRLARALVATDHGRLRSVWIDETKRT